MSAAAGFSQSYSEARAKFLDAARGAGAVLDSIVNPKAKGPDGEELATDVARFGPADADRVLITNSATHGVEGFCGSGSQIGTIREGLVRRLPKGVALVMIHAINPYGFAWWRRVTEDNVDLNRNFRDHNSGPPPNPAYDEVHDWLIPADWDGPARAVADHAIADYVRQRGLSTFQAAVSGGQYGHADGMFFGGRAATWSNGTFRAQIRRHAGQARRIGFVDFHTGLGPSGYGEPIFPGPTSQPGYARARAWYGPDVTSPEGGTSTSAVVQGTLINAFETESPKAEVTPIALEYGTLSVFEVLSALRADNWLHLRGDPRSALGRRIRREVRDAFYVDTDEWKTKVLARALELTDKALKALAA